MAGKPANARRYQLVSVDDHVIEPPDVWETRLPAALRERGPRMQRTEKGEVWVIAGKRVRGIVGLGAMAGWRFEDYTPRNLSFQEIRRGCYDAKARLEDMDTDGVDAQVLFGTMVGFAGSVFIELAREDAELAHACVRAYNDWLASEWCAADPERLIPQCILPLWDLGAAHAELLRALDLGHRAVLLPALPHALDLPGAHRRALGADPLDLLGGGRADRAPHRRLDGEPGARLDDGQGARARLGRGGRGAGGHRAAQQLRRARGPDLLGPSRALPRSQARLGGGRHRLGALLPRAHGLDLHAPPVLDPVQAEGAPEPLLQASDVRDVHRRRRGDRRAEAHRCRERDVGVGLPALGHHLAELTALHRRADGLALRARAHQVVAGNAVRLYGLACRDAEKEIR